MQADTRFKTWWHLVGAPIEHAASLIDFPGDRIRFRDEFMANEADDEQGSALADVMTILANQQWPGELIRAASVAEFARSGTAEAAEFLAALDAASGYNQLHSITAGALTWRLKSLIDAPVCLGKRLVCLRWVPNQQGNRHLSHFLLASLR